MKKIRILYTIPNFDTCGSGIALLKLITNLDKSMFEPMIMCLHSSGKLFEQVRASGIPYYIYPYLPELKLRPRFIKDILRTAKYMRKLKPDIVFSYNYSANFSEAVSARLAGAKFIYVKKNMAWRWPIYPVYFCWKIKTWLSSAITVQNTDMMKEFFKGNPKASIISFGVDTKEFYQRPKNLKLKKEFKILPSKKVILCVANITPKKGINYLLEGFSHSKHKSCSVLLIVGDDNRELGKELHNLKDNLSLKDNVIFTGKRFDVADFLSIADLFILPSTGNEGAPVAIQEAMASGVVVITTDTPGNRDQLDELQEQIIPPKDSTAISSSIDKFLNLAKKEKIYIINKQLKIIEKRYTLQEEVKKHQKLYINLLRKRK